MKAISPVIATVIIVAVAIVIAVAVAFWMTGITGIFTRYEKLEITYAYATWNDTYERWEITLKIRNTGPSDATIDEIFINGMPYGDITPTVATTTTIMGGDTITIPSPTTISVNPDVSGTISISSGDEETIYILIPLSDKFKHGQTVEIKIHTAAGNEYPKQVTLP